MIPYYRLILFTFDEDYTSPFVPAPSTVGLQWTSEQGRMGYTVPIIEEDESE